MSDHILAQARLGEFALLQDEARTMTAHEFATKHGAPVRGTGVYLHRVTVDGCDYFWNPDTGKFDGWGRSV